ncbi:Uma2 family endonuclease [Pseudanabaenaceae cyanobacterium LEGE 13415]|nr:Uma2 family endonuclease [Pseudanabaenaceae cyanobacterium LEGE 13415]
MTQAKPRFRTLEDYLNYDDGTDTWYELVDGELIALPSENPLNFTIAMLLVSSLLQLGIPYYRLAIGHQIQVVSAEVTVRQPDLVVHTEESIRALLSGERIIRMGMPVPMVVVEVVSPGKPGSENYDRDYVEKPREYAERGIPEYWLIDPSRAVVVVMTLHGDRYQTQEFRNEELIVSTAFPAFQLTAKQILEAGA